MKMKVFIPGDVTINVNLNAGDNSAAELRIFEKMLTELSELLEELPDEEPGEPADPTMDLHCVQRTDPAPDRTQQPGQL